LTQRDTYFDVPIGRLKLREEQGNPAQLIAYSRPDREESRESRYRIVEVKQAEELIAVLSETLGTVAVVAKQRQLFLWRGARLHLDQVDGLGSFLELEAVATPGSDLSAEAGKVQLLREAFQIDDADLVAGSYCDLILASR
jgi:predicted adenylyl cyclase CyaB